MYSPEFYRQSQLEPAIKLIEEYGFATLLSFGENPMVSHLPMIMSINGGGERELLSHMARANPHWQELKKLGQGKALFHGPHAYISPAWYQPAADNVPTWNYVVTHVQGQVEQIGDRMLAFDAMRLLVQKFEGDYGTTWSLPNESKAIDILMSGITVFKLKNLSFETKFKLSQKQNPVDRGNVIKGLKGLGLDDLAGHMERSSQ